MEGAAPEPKINLPMPNTDVSFGVTPSFARSFPNEVDTQLEKFNRPTWQTRTAVTHEAVAEAAKAPPPAFVPRTLPEKKARTLERTVDPSTFAYLQQGDGMMFFGLIFFAGVAYLLARGVQWHF